MHDSVSNVHLSDEYFPKNDGRTFPKWMEIYETCHQLQSEKAQNAFMQDVVLKWATQICDESIEELQIVKSRNFLVIASTDKRRRKALANYCETSRKKIIKLLNSVSDGFLPVNVVIALGSDASYYEYLSAYYPEGDFASSSGIFLSGTTYPHIVIHSPELESYHTVLAHEMAHMAMNHLTLPLWLNEGITQTVERDIAPDAGYHYIDEIAMRELESKSREFWNRETIQQFWSGEAFHREHSQDVAYYFARVLFYLIHREVAGSREQVAGFVSKADYEDAGEASFFETFKASLNDLIEEILGEGDWAPRPDSWEEESSE